MSTPTNTTLAPGLARKVKKVRAAVAHASSPTVSCWHDDCHGPPQGTLHKNVSSLSLLQILEIKTESSDLINSLSTLSSFYHDNNPAARRALRTTIERRGLDINQKFLTAAEAVIKASVQLDRSDHARAGAASQQRSILLMPQCLKDGILNHNGIFLHDATSRPFHC